MKRWRVGDVQRLGAVGDAGETWGIALYDETGKPCVTFGYPKETDAEAGREHIKAALRNFSYHNSPSLLRGRVVRAAGTVAKAVAAMARPQYAGV